ncbi:MAG TPA: EAL domain-containing protein [Edaphobacter sp.]|nr:EAL domain-containing protein [Edaphobacter sp.]
MFQSMQSSHTFAPRVNGLFPEFEIFFQPIVDLQHETIYAYEALCRGLQGESYPLIVAGMQTVARSGFDKLAMAKTLRLAAELGLQERGAKISLNVGPAGDAGGIDTEFVVRTAKHYGIEPTSLVLEMTEDIRMNSLDLLRIIDRHRAAGMVVAIDDFGAGYAGLNVLASCTPDVLKLDRELVMSIDSSFPRKTIVGAFVNVCKLLGVKVVAEGVETLAECRTLRELGIDMMQGYLFAYPVLGEIPLVHIPGKASQMVALSQFGALPALN